MIKSKWRRWAVTGVAILALAPVIPGLLLAEAHSFTAKSSVTIRWAHRHHKFHGTVDSKRVLCVPGRTVDVFKARPGRDRLIGSDVTGNQGKYSVRYHKRHARGRFYAKVLRSSSGGYGHSHVCQKARSDTIHIGS